MLYYANPHAFTPRTSPYTKTEIREGYAPRRDWQHALDNSNEFSCLLRKRRAVDYGAFGVVYEVDGSAVKIGCINEGEPFAQQWVYETHERALPVWAFDSDVSLPNVVTREVCPHHGYLANMWERESVNCHCGERMAVLVMPLARSASEVSDRQWCSIGGFIHNALFDALGICWDMHSRNFLNFNRRLMLCDFGETEGSYAEGW